MSETSRPNPDKLLEKIQQEETISGRGSLKIFFGACAGVGKTYAMLNEAQQRLRDGVDVVIGIVETHGREETAKWVKDLPEIPRKITHHRGVEIKEFDLDEAIARKPTLLLLDELAHTNAPGSRHPKRWMDVEELLNKGVDIYTTLNVQHLESINDLVARTSGIQVKETVPDGVFDRADHVSLVDIPTDELLNRLKSGKVYVAEQARKNAADNFFEKRNLIALRELALRRTAERVDAQMGVETTTGRDVMLSEKIMVCIGHDSLSTRVIRHTKRVATRMKAPWFAVYVETGRHYRLGKKNQETVERNMQLAERMGGTVVFLKGDNAVEELLTYAKERGISRIIVGLRHRGWLRDFLVGTLAEKLIRKSANVEINVLTEEGGKRNLHLLFSVLSAKPMGFICATVAVALCTTGLLPFRGKIDPTNLVMMYVITVMLVASRFGTLPSIMASMLGVGAFNFFFTEPYHSFNVHYQGYHFTFVVMFIASLLIGSIASRLRLRAMFYRQKETEIRHLFSLAKALSSTRGHENMALAAAKYVSDALNAVVMVFLPSDSEGLQLISGVDMPVDLREKSAAQWAFENGQQAGSGTDTLSATKGRYVPLMEEDRAVGVMGVIPLKEQELDPEQITMLEAFSTIMAISLQRATKSLEAEQSRIEAEAQKLRNTLLQSVSHDLRTPLVSISGLSAELLAKRGYLPPMAEEMVKTIYDQSSKLSKMVKNILDITGLESGKMKLNKQPYFLEEIIGSALMRLKNILPENAVDFNIRTKDLIDVDGLLIEQVFTNLLENAVKYNRSNIQITISVEDKKKYLQIYVIDNGPGIAKGEEGKIFEKFHKGTKEGTGLGLPICKSIVEAHGGQIWAKSTEGGGAMFIFTLPKSEASMPAMNEETENG
ncbi:MAG: sensor histidine kinase KdpD [Rickettsiales bacterium]